MESDEYKKLYSLLSALSLKGKKTGTVMEEQPAEKKIVHIEQEEIHVIPLSEMVPRKRGRPFKKKKTEK